MISVLGILCNDLFHSEVSKISNSNHEEFTDFMHTNLVHIICGITIVVTPTHILLFEGITIE